MEGSLVKPEWIKHTNGDFCEILGRRFKIIEATLEFHNVRNMTSGEFRLWLESKGFSLEMPIESENDLHADVVRYFQAIDLDAGLQQPQKITIQEFRKWMRAGCSA